MAFRKDDRLKDGPMPQYAGARAEVDDTLYGRDIEWAWVLVFRANVSCGLPYNAMPPNTKHCHSPIQLNALSPPRTYSPLPLPLLR